MLIGLPGTYVIREGDEFCYAEVVSINYRERTAIGWIDNIPYSWDIESGEATGNQPTEDIVARMPGLSRRAMLREMADELWAKQRKKEEIKEKRQNGRQKIIPLSEPSQ